MLTLRRMRSADVPAVMAIESVSFGRFHWSGDAFLNELGNHLGRYWVLAEKPDALATEEALIGYCGIWIVLDEAHMTTVAVHPNARGRSLGELQLAHVIDRCQASGIHWLTLEVRVSNIVGQSLYHKYGLSIVGRRTRYYQDTHEDALVMTSPDLLTEDYRAHVAGLRPALLAKLGEPGLPKGFGQA